MSKRRKPAAPPHPCGCGCGTMIVGRGAHVLYVDERHRQRAYRKRVEEAAKASGLPSRLTLETVQSTNRSQGRNRDAKRTRRPRQVKRRQGVSVYLPQPELLAVVEAALATDERVNHLDGDAAHRTAIEAVRKAKARLDAKR